MAEAIVKVALSHSYSEVLNVGSGKSTRVLDIVTEVAKLYQIQIDENEYAKKTAIDFYADKEEMEQAFDWCGTTSIAEGVKKMIEAER